MNNPTGRETAPHITVRYGLHSQDSAEVLGHIASEQPPYVTIGSSSVFECEDFDVVKLNVSGESLDALHAKLGELDHTDTHPDYQPHITLAYVKKGEGKKYVGKLNDLNGATITLDSLVFSDGEKTKTTAVLGYTKSSGCGANGPGGGGFKPGNSCASGGGKVGSFKEQGLIEADQLISSQRFRDDDTVQQKLDDKDFEVFISPVFEIDGDTFQAVLDGHHSLSAAKKAGVQPEFTVMDKRGHDAIAHLDRGDVDTFLEATHLGDDFYDAETGKDVW